MALVSCSECGKEISDKATSCPHCGAPKTGNAATQASSVQPQAKKGGLWKWVIGIPIALFAFVMIVGSNLANTPEGREKASAREKIGACWDIQQKKSLDPSTARFTARMCETMEDDFRKRYGVNP